MENLRLIEATAADLDCIMDLERQGFDAGHQELRSAYGHRIATFPHGSLMAWLGPDCVGCVFSEIWRFAPQPEAAQFTLGHDIRERHDSVLGTELYISSLTLSPTVRGQKLGAPFMRGCMDQIALAYPQLQSVLLLVNAAWTPARRIYEGLGFREIANLARFFTPHGTAPEDGIVMRRPIKLQGEQQTTDS
jgi:ribosomal protein S18 acetylase RimI-like enzyme